MLYENGMEVLMDYPRLRGKLWDLAPAEDLQRQRFRALYDTGAMDCIREAVRDAVNGKAHFERALELLMGSPDMPAAAARETLGLFYEALGFPVEAPVSDSQLIREENCEYVGQVREGLRHGRGKEVLYDDGQVYYTRWALWLRGEIFGYYHGLDDLGVNEYGFCIRSRLIGKVTHVWPDGTVCVDEY